MANDVIGIKGARQNNLKGFDLQLPLYELIVITGVSGSGKSSLAFDTVYAEGQRRYVETFSPYARQFLDRMDKPQVDRIEGIPPAIAIDQTNPVRTSRSTVGTMTELNDHLKLLFARAAQLYCRGCGQVVTRDTPESIVQQLFAKSEAALEARIMITFSVLIPGNVSETELRALLESQGYARIHQRRGNSLEVIQDRVRLAEKRRDRIVEALEAAFKGGKGQLTVYPLDRNRMPGEPWRFSAALHCPDCDIAYQDPSPNLFSFNSPMGACENCRGFGRTIGIDYGLVIPDETKTLAEGAVKPWQTESYRECQDDLLRFAQQRALPVDVPWRRLTKGQRRWVLEGEGEWEDGIWYGVQRFFAWLETKSYKMHIRVLLSKYRAYDTCRVCHGARLKPDALLWRLGNHEDADQVLPEEQRFHPASMPLSATRYKTLPGLHLHEVMLLPLERCRIFFDHPHLPTPLDEATDLLVGEIGTRLRYLADVGLGYLTLDRQSRTLSGGEVQRVNLTTALGTSLVNTLFVLDEPSIGLHPRDIQRVIGVLQRLRDAGNSLLVVEHDPQIMAAADRILDMGPGPGGAGGQVVFSGTPDELLNTTSSLTALYLSGQKKVAPELPPPSSSNRYLEILGATAHNLKQIDVKIPLNQLVCITGVSGSGKSTLVQDTLYNGLRKLKGKPVDPPGRYKAIRGQRHIDDVLLIDQSPIGKTTRSNPASYVGAWDGIRKLFAAQPLAQERNYSRATFSFNAGNGRCPTCCGAGFEHVEMQFLSDVYLRCPDCDGRRFRSEILEVKLFPPHNGQGMSIADVLDMTIAEAASFFAESADIARVLEVLMAVGLSYLTLGQPVPTLSGGEAQRLKLAGHLAKASPHKGSLLFLFDEPTTGLHFDDINKLLGAFRRLLANGHSLLIIEHNLDVIRAADWLIDLGPEGGDAGGQVVFEGTPLQLTTCQHSYTGQALREYQTQGSTAAFQVAENRASFTVQTEPVIGIHHAREHNLKNIDITLPRDKFTVISGISGSGKSTVAFDILFAEGQRRYLESLNAYARQFVQPAAKPDVDAIFGIPPTVAIEQRTSRGGHKSTVATLTEIYHFLRLLFVKLGVQYCPTCAIPIEPQSFEAITAKLLRDYRGQQITLLAPLVVARKGYYTELAKWARGRGFPLLRVDGAWIATDHWPRLDRFKEHNIELPVGEIRVNAKNEAGLRDLLERALDYGKGRVQMALQQTASNPPAETIFSTQRACPSCGRSFEELDPRLFSFNSKHGWCHACYGTGLRLPDAETAQNDTEIPLQPLSENEAQMCSACHGQRLRPEALAVRFQDQSIAEYTQRSVESAEKFFRRLRLRGREAAIAQTILAELRTRLAFLKTLGLAYLTLDRAAPTLSGGEAQRIRLAAQLGSNLRGVCYILDEPTIGLHPRDNRMLLDTLTKLEEKGNTVVVVEHDEDTIRRAEHVIDLGPGAGHNGGEVIAAGSVQALMNNARSLTGQFLANPLRHPLDQQPPRYALDKEKNQSKLKVLAACLHNLKNLTMEIPLGTLVCITGVSGSGKSTLVRDIIYDNLQRLLSHQRGRRRKAAAQVALLGCQALLGWETIQRVVEVDQTPIGKTPRSCPATYVGFWDAIRRLFAETPEARLRGYGPGRFSFNVRGGRCEACEGQGRKKIAMSFLPDVEVPCEICHGARFNSETLAVYFKDKNIGEVLAMSVDEAVEFFAVHTAVHHGLRLLQEVGLGYLTLGQQSPTLSGGEAQRIKLVTELAKTKPHLEIRQNRRNHTLYVLDEPTVGLHMADVEKLIRVLHQLVNAGNSVMVIEHNLDIVAEADWVVDLGPEGGRGGGQIVAQGTPQDITRVRKGSHTAKFLRDFLKQRSIFTSKLN